VFGEGRGGSVGRSVRVDVECIWSSMEIII
jgi:hypothetical protein